LGRGLASAPIVQSLLSVSPKLTSHSYTDDADGQLLTDTSGSHIIGDNDNLYCSALIAGGIGHKGGLVSF
jgi:hypothetical protein